MLPISQSHLTLLETCPRKYQHVFFDALLGPSTYEQHTKAQWGSQFHRLMQQQALDLPVEVLGTADAEMAESLAALKAAAPEVFAYLPDSQVASDRTVSTKDVSTKDVSTFSQSEHRRTLSFSEYLLTVVYDLVVIAPSADPSQSSGQKNRRGQIFDWKTYQQPQKKDWLAKDWQTRLYPYVLCETSDLSPEDVSMTYWFVRSSQGTPDAPFEPSSYTFAYGTPQHEQTQRDLQRLTETLTRMREQTFFPKVAVEKGPCQQCPFAVRCDRAASINTSTNSTTSSSASNDPNDRYADLQQLLKAAQQVNADSVKELPL